MPRFVFGARVDENGLEFGADDDTGGDGDGTAATKAEASLEESRN